MREWIATKWDGEAPDHLKKALSTGDPKDLGMLIHEWSDFKAAKANRAVVESCPTGFVYFVRHGGQVHSYLSWHGYLGDVGAGLGL